MYGKRVELTKERADIIPFDIKDIDPYEVFHFYIGVIPNVKKPIITPFKQERTPSFYFYINEEGVLKFKCWSTGHGGNCIDFVAILYNIEYKEAIVKIIREVYEKQQITGNKVQSTDVYVKPIHGVFTPKTDVKVEVILRDWIIQDIAYWKQYGLSIDDLNYWNVKPCKQVWIYDTKLYYSYRTIKDLCYRYLINSRYKIYRPLITGKGKWLSNMLKKDVQGYNMLPDKGELLVITKSLKDVMVLKKHLNINAISFGSESVTISKVTADYLYTRFDKIVLFYDNDEAGLINMERISKLTNIPFISISKELNTKDPADLYRDHGKEIFKDVTTKLLGI